MFSGINVSYIWALSHVFGQCLMFSGINVLCIRAMPHVFGQCLMYLGDASCVRAMSHVFGQCLNGKIQNRLELLKLKCPDIFVGV